MFLLICTQVFVDKDDIWNEYEKTINFSSQINFICDGSFILAWLQVNNNTCIYEYV